VGEGAFENGAVTQSAPSRFEEEERPYWQSRRSLAIWSGTLRLGPFEPLIKERLAIHGEGGPGGCKEVANGARESFQ
jgi:hypothetical protein